MAVPRLLLIFCLPKPTAPHQARFYRSGKGLRIAGGAQDWPSLRATINAQIINPDDAFARAMKNAPVMMATMMSDEATGRPDAQSRYCAARAEP